MFANTKIKVLHIVHSMPHGGIETFLVSMLKIYNHDRFQMDIIYTGPEKGEYADEVRSLGARLIPCRLHYEQIRFVSNFYKFLRREKYDVVNSHYDDLGGGAMLAAWLARVPVRIASYHTDRLDRGFLRNLYMRIMRYLIVRTATNITTSSPSVSDSYFSEVPAPKVMVRSISYGVDTDFFAQKPAKTLDLKKYGFDENHLIVGHVGSYRPQKNHRALLKIAKRIINDVPNARFLLRGALCTGRMVTGHTKEDITRQIDELGLSNYIVHIESLEDMREFYSVIDIFILPSRHEGMPISLIEAEASGKPIVASSIGGIVIATAPEMRNNLFEIDDIESFSKCLIDLLKDKQKRIVQGRAGQEYVRENLDIKIAVKKYEQLYLPKDNSSED